MKPKLEEFKLNLNLGTEDVLLTSFLIFIISIAISMFLGKNIKKYDEKRYKYIILPNYNNKNSIKMLFSGILQIKLVNIISTVFKLGLRNKKKVIKGKECEQV